MEGRRQLVMIVILVVYCTSMAAAQQETTSAPSTLPSQSNPGQEPSQTEMNSPTQGQEQNPPAEPQTTPLSSGITLTAGSEGSNVSYLLPSFQWSGNFNRSLAQTSGSSGLTANSVYVGNLVVQEVRKRSQLNLDYAVGGQFFYRSALTKSKVRPPSYGIFQKMAITETRSFHRLQLSLSDQLLYLPESSTGYGGFSGLQSFGAGSGGASLGNIAQISPSLLPNQSVLTGASRRIANTALGEVRYSLGGRSSISVTGTYGLLHFLDSGFIDNHYYSFLSGYNYRINYRNQIGIIYVQNLYLFNAHNQGLLNRGFQLSYSRQITSRIKLSLSGGPLANKVAQPQGGSVTKAFWTTNDSLSFLTRKFDLDCRFSRFTTGGSGVLHGAETNSLTLTAGRELFRKYRGAVDASHSFNQSLRQDLTLLSQTKFETWAVGVEMSHEFKDNISLFAHYQFQRQNSNQSLCFGADCGRVFVRQSAGFGINWHGRPHRIR